MPIQPDNPFHWRHYEPEVILTCVRWYLDLPLSYRNVAKLMRERGLPTHQLLYCESCATRMVYSYAGKNDRKYPYYLCLNAQGSVAKTLEWRSVD